MHFFKSFSLLLLAGTALAAPAPKPSQAPSTTTSDCQTCDIVGIFTTLKANVQAPCESLQVLVSADITLEVIQPHLTTITSALNDAITQVKALDVSVDVSVSFTTLFGSVSYFSVCSLMAEVSTLIITVLAAVCKLLTTVNSAACLPVIQAVACLVADLHVCVFALLSGTLSFVLSIFNTILFKALAPCHDPLDVIGVLSYWVSSGIKI